MSASTGIPARSLKWKVRCCRTSNQFFPLVETAMVSKLIQPSVKTALAEYVKHCRALGSTSADYRGSL
jgi:hypothetical protein